MYSLGRVWLPVTVSVDVVVCQSIRNRMGGLHHHSMEFEAFDSSMFSKRAVVGLYGFNSSGEDFVNLKNWLL